MQTETQEQQQPPVYFAVGPQPHDISCPFCKQYSKTIMKRSILRSCLRRHYCSQCGEYLGSYRRPQL